MDSLGSGAGGEYTGGGNRIVRQIRRRTYLLMGVVGYTTSVSIPWVAH